MAPIFVPLDFVPVMKEAVARGAARVGRDPAEVELACYLPTSVSEDVDAAKLAAKYDVAIHMSSYHYYRTYFNRRGKGHIASQVAARVDAGDMEAAVELIDDEMADAVTVYGTPEIVPREDRRLPGGRDHPADHLPALPRLP